MDYSDNFFIEQLGDYYGGQGKKLSDAIIIVLSKSIAELTEAEMATYQKTIQPAREAIRQALGKCLKSPGAKKEEWQEQLLMLHDTIIGDIAAELLQQNNIEKQYAEQQAGLEESPLTAAPMAGKSWRGPADISKGKVSSGTKRYIVYSGISLIVLAAIMISLALTVFKGPRRQLGTTLMFSLPNGFKSEIQHEEELCGFTVHTIRVFPEGAEKHEGIFLIYPYPDPVCYTRKYIEDYPYEMTRLAGQAAITYTTQPSQQLGPALSSIRGEADLSAFVIYMVDGQILIDGSPKYKYEMLNIARSIEWDHPVFETPPVFTSDTKELEGTWTQIDDSDHALSLFPDFHEAVFHCHLQGTDNTYWGNADGRIFKSGEENGLGRPKVAAYVYGDGSELYMLLEDYDGGADFSQQRSGAYRKLSDDPYYVFGSPKPGDIDWKAEADYPEGDFSISATRLLMDAILDEDYTTIINLLGVFADYGGIEDYFVSLRPARYRILSYKAVGDYITIVVQYENEMSAVHQLELAWETFSTASKTPYLYDFQLDP